MGNESSQTEITRLRTLLVLRELQNGRAIAHPVSAPQLASIGIRERVLEEQELFLGRYLMEQDAATLSSFTMPEGCELVVIPIQLERSDLPRAARIPQQIDVYGVSIPDPRGTWVDIITPHHTVFVARGEDLQEVVKKEIERVIAALDPNPTDALRLFPPALGCSLEAIHVEIERNAAAPGGSVARRRALLSEREQKKQAIEVLASVGELWTDSRQALRHAAMDGAALRQPIAFREREQRQLAALLEAPQRTSVLLVGDELSGRGALLDDWYAARAGAGHEVRIYSTSAAQLIAGMSARGQWQARLARVLESAERLDAILYFDDLADLFGDHSDGHVDIPSAMLRALQNAKVRVVGRITAETLDVLEPRGVSFFNAFHRVRVAPLSVEQTTSIISLRIRSAATERVRLREDVAKTLVQLVERYQPYRALPGKAVRFYEQLLDAHARVTSQDQLLEGSHVQRWLSRQTGIPEALLREDLPLEVEFVEQRLGAKLIGQKPAVRAVAEAISVVKANLQPSGKPLANLLFVGPTGVGKTELARSLASFLFGSPDRLLRFDMSEYRDGLAAERLIHGTESQEGLLTREVRRQPFCVLLFDEIEKAGPSVFDLLLGVLGEARLSDANGRTTYFHNSLIIMTSNLGVTHSRQGLGLLRGESDAQATYTRAIREHFRPEFINRLDRVVPFSSLSQQEIETVLQLLLESSGRRRGFVERGVELALSAGARSQIADGGYSPSYGARALRRELEDQVLAPVAGLLSLMGAEAKGSEVYVRLASEEPAANVFKRSQSQTLHFDLVRRGGRKAAKSELSAFSQVSEAAERGRGWLDLDPVDDLKSRIEYLRTELSQMGRGREGRRQKLMGAQHERLRKELGDLEQIWGAVQGPLEELEALEELAFASLVVSDTPDRDAANSLRAEGSRAELNLKRGVVPALLARLEGRDEILLMLRELDSNRALDRWWRGFPEACRARGWQAEVHPPSSLKAPKSGWPEGSYWSDPEPSSWMDAFLADGNRKSATLLLAVKGRFAGALLALEAGFQSFSTQGVQDRSRSLQVLRMGARVSPEKTAWQHSRMRPPDLPRPEVLAREVRVRSHELKEQFVKLVPPLPDISYAGSSYWERLDDVAFSILVHQLGLGSDINDVVPTTGAG
ncbi:MAG: AAA family ATPase [Polyangiaceae bacterium]